MSLYQAVLYGIIQGLTEFLPISSTAHLRIVPALFGWNDPGAAFTAVIQFGTLVAVLLYFRKDIIAMAADMVIGLMHKKMFHTRQAIMGWMIGAGTIPIVLIGVLFKKDIETTLRSLYVVAAAMIGLALLLLVAEILEKRRQSRALPLKTISDLSWTDAMLVGLAQAVALIPGSSRSGVTITAGLFLGCTRETAARFSFLLSLPSVLAAGFYELYKQRQELFSPQVGLLNLIAATVVSGIVGYVSIAFLLDYLKKHTTYIFIYYRLLVGILLFILLWNGSLNPLG